MLGKLPCPAQLSGSMFSLAAIAIPRPRVLSPAVSAVSAVSKAALAISSRNETLFSRRRAIGPIARACTYAVNETNKHVPAVSWIHRLAGISKTSPWKEMHIQSAARSLQSWNRKPLQEQVSLSRIGSLRLLSTKPTTPRWQERKSNNSISGKTLADFDDVANSAATLQKSLAAVPHHAVKNEMTLRITELDPKGVLKTRTGEFLKTDLCQQHRLHPRDLRKIDGGFSNQIPVILVRPEVIIVNLGHIRALIKSDLVILFDSPDSKDQVEDSPFIKDLQERLKMSTVEARGQPFEFRALEAIFISVVASLHAEMEVLVHFVTKLLTDLEDDINRTKLKELLQYTKKVSRFESRTLLIRDVFEELLEQNEDLAGMYLTEKKAGHPRAVDSHDEAEILLESYMKQVEEIANVISMVKHSMQSTEDFVNVFLAAKRTQLLLFELRVAMGTLGISSGAIVAGLYGMNLQNYLEHDPNAFFIVSATAAVIGGTVFAACARKLRVLAKGTT